MKKYILFAFLFLGVFPFVRHGKIGVSGISKAAASGYFDEMGPGPDDPDAPDNSGTKGAQADPDYGTDDPTSCLNCHIANSDWQDFVDFKTVNNSLTVNAPVQFSQMSPDGTTLVPGQLTTFTDAAGNLAGAFFTPDSPGGPFTYGVQTSLMGAPQGDTSAAVVTNPNVDPSVDYFFDTFTEPFEYDYVNVAQSTYAPYIQSGDPFIVPTTPPVFGLFSATQINSEIAARTKNPNLIDQGSTGLCGMAVIAKTLAEKDPSTYKLLISELYYTGHATYTKTNYNLNANVILETMNPSSPSYPTGSGGGKMPEADLILLGSMRNTVNTLMRYSPGTDYYSMATGISTDRDIVLLMSGLLGMIDIRDNTYYLGFTSFPIDELLYIEQDSQAGRTSNILMDGNMITDPTNTGISLGPDHWAQYVKGSLALDFGQNMAHFDVYCWGGYQHISVSFANFSKFYYGRVSGYWNK